MVKRITHFNLRYKIFRFQVVAKNGENENIENIFTIYFAEFKSNDECEKYNSYNSITFPETIINVIYIQSDKQYW